MTFSCKILLSEHMKLDKSRMVYLRAIIDRKPAKVALGFYVTDEMFDAKRQCIKPAHPNADTFNTELSIAIAKGNSIASEFRIKKKVLTPELFRKEFDEPSADIDVIKFIEQELELKRPSLAANTYKQHVTVINKLKAFKKSISFAHLNVELLQKFRNALLKEELGNATIEKIIKIFKQYLGDAQRKGIVFKFPEIKIKSFKSNRLGLSQEEVDLMDKYYDDPACPASHKKILRYFLFSCYTGIRISDVSQITWDHIHDDLLIFVPVKTKYNQESVTVPLGPKDKKYLPEYQQGKAPIFDTYADQVSNRYLKDIADKLKIRKKVTYHMSRHTFGSLFAEGGNVVALQRIMGHSDIKTTMGYVHTSTKVLIDAKKERFG